MNASEVTIESLMSDIGFQAVQLADSKWAMRLIHLAEKSTPVWYGAIPSGWGVLREDISAELERQYQDMLKV